jgi:hypothetical protein
VGRDNVVERKGQHGRKLKLKESGSEKDQIALRIR